MEEISDNTVSKIVDQSKHIGRFYIDALLCIAKFIPDEDLMMWPLVCKQFYRMCQRREIRMRIAYPFKPQYKLTIDQIGALREMSSKPGLCKIVDGDVGSGKTWVAISYIMRKYYNRDVKIVFVVPPANIHQWATILLKITDLRIVSNHTDCKLYNKQWDTMECDAYLTSFLLSGKLLKKFEHEDYVVIHDEAHTKSSVENHFSTKLPTEYIMFTASTNTILNKVINKSFIRQNNLQVDVIKLEAKVLKEHLLPVEEIIHYIDFSPELINECKLIYIEEYLMENNKKMSEHTFYKLQTIWCYGFIQAYSIKIDLLINNKTKTFNPTINPYIPQALLNQKELIEYMHELPKIRKISEIVLHNIANKEKTIIFDTNQDMIPFVCLYLQKKHNIKCNLFCTGLFTPKQRASQLEKFKKDGHVLLGSNGMLSEGHNITEANNIIFLRYPTKGDIFKQSIGRCNRYPQQKVVKVHYIFYNNFEGGLINQIVTNKREDHIDMLEYKRYYKHCVPEVTNQYFFYKTPLRKRYFLQMYKQYPAYYQKVYDFIFGNYAVDPNPGYDYQYNTMKIQSQNNVVAPVNNNNNNNDFGLSTDEIDMILELTITDLLKIGYNIDTINYYKK